MDLLKPAGHHCMMVQKVYIDNSGSMFFVATSNLSPRGYLTNSY